MVLGDDDVNLGKIVFLGCEEVRLVPAAANDRHALLETGVHGAVAEKVAVEVDLGRHDDHVQVEPPDPLGFGEFVEAVDDSGELGPDRVSSFQIIAGDIDKAKMVTMQIRILLPILLRIL